MAIPLDISASVPEKTIADFVRACGRYKDELGNRQAVAIRRGTIALVKSLRARTAKSAKIAPTKDVTKYDGRWEGKPNYITPKGKGQKPQHRWAIHRRGGDRARTYVKPADSKADARRRFGKYTRWGLARKSWGWFMKALFNRSAPADNPRAKIDDRMTHGYLREVVTGPSPRVEVLIVNKLDYIRDALPKGALEESMTAATRSINTQIDEGITKARKELD